MKKLKLILVILLIYSGAFAQNVGINADGSAPDASAMLDVSSITSGFLAPRMTEAQRTAIGTPATGLLVYQTDETAGYYYYNGSVWTQIGLAAEASQWTTSVSNIYYNTGNIGIGTSTPTQKLHVFGTSEEKFSYGLFDATDGEENITLYIGADIRAEVAPHAGIDRAAKVLNTSANVPMVIENVYSQPLVLGTSDTERMRINANGNVGIGTTSPTAKLDVEGVVACSAFAADYTNTYTIDGIYESGTWFPVIPVGTLTSMATYVISIHYTNNSFGPPYYLDASTTIMTSHSNGDGTGNEVILPTSSHVVYSGYSIAVRNRMSTGNVSTGLDVQLNLYGTSTHSGETITVNLKRIF